MMKIYIILATIGLCANISLSQIDLGDVTLPTIGYKIKEFERFKINKNQVAKLSYIQGASGNLLEVTLVIPDSGYQVIWHVIIEEENIIAIRKQWATDERDPKKIPIQGLGSLSKVSVVRVEKNLNADQQEELSSEQKEIVAYMDLLYRFLADEK